MSVTNITLVSTGEWQIGKSQRWQDFDRNKTQLSKETLLEEDEIAKRKRIKTLNARIRRWFIYRVRKSHKRRHLTKDLTKDPFAVLLAKLSGLKIPPKARQPFQQMMHEDYKEKIAPAVLDAWGAAQARQDKETELTQKPKAGFRAKVARDIFAVLPESERKALGVRATKEAAFTKALKGGPSKLPADRQKCINEVGDLIRPILCGLEEATGFHYLLLGGGPVPKYGGELRTIHVSVGRNNTVAAPHFAQWDRPRFQENVLKFMTEYLATAFTPEECAAAAMPDTAALAAAKYTIDKGANTEHDDSDESDLDSSSSSSSDDSEDEDSDSEDEGRKRKKSRSETKKAEKSKMRGKQTTRPSAAGTAATTSAPTAPVAFPSSPNTAATTSAPTAPIAFPSSLNTTAPSTSITPIAIPSTPAPGTAMHTVAVAGSPHVDLYRQREAAKEHNRLLQAALFSGVDMVFTKQSSAPKRTQRTAKPATAMRPRRSTWLQSGDDAVMQIDAEREGSLRGDGMEFDISPDPSPPSTSSPRPLSPDTSPPSSPQVDGMEVDISPDPSPPFTSSPRPSSPDTSPPLSPQVDGIEVDISLASASPSCHSSLDASPPQVDGMEVDTSPAFASSLHHPSPDSSPPASCQATTPPLSAVTTTPRSVSAEVSLPPSPPRCSLYPESTVLGDPPHAQELPPPHPRPRPAAPYRPSLQH
ncbi:hypothetical protein DFH07DRAFT_963663 [Mycena maculata]|uniref:Uncharacterized protein n=1 Tax=Mycena maculata TaxID=230809 RepID=A0AAD7IJ89_9AGAR|nr:hypothetical protein DFH07DRAFT_963663 [Mycena maculata]